MRALVLFAAVVTLAGCALRPRYGEFLGKESTEAVRLQVVEKSSGVPVAGAAVEVGETLRGKMLVKTDANGVFLLPVDKRLMEDNALIVVTAPAGVGRVKVLRAEDAAAPVALPPLVIDPVPAAEEPADAGTITY